MGIRSASRVNLELVQLRALAQAVEGMGYHLAVLGDSFSSRSAHEDRLTAAEKFDIMAAGWRRRIGLKSGTWC